MEWKKTKAKYTTTRSYDTIMQRRTGERTSGVACRTCTHSLGPVLLLTFVTRECRIQSGDGDGEMFLSECIESLID